MYKHHVYPRPTHGVYVCACVFVCVYVSVFVCECVCVFVRVQVSGVDLQAASHEEAVNAIKSAQSPVIFVVQSLSATPRVPTHTHTVSRGGAKRKRR